MDPMQCARLAALEGALLALMREAAMELDVSQVPDGICARLDHDGLQIEYTHDGMPVAGEGI